MTDTPEFDFKIAPDGSLASDAKASEDLSENSPILETELENTESAEDVLVEDISVIVSDKPAVLEPIVYTVKSYDMVLKVSSDKVAVWSRFVVVRGEGIPLNAPLILNGVNLHLSSCKVVGQLLSSTDYEKTPDGLIIFKTPDADSFEVEIISTSSVPNTNGRQGLLRLTESIALHAEPIGLQFLTYCIDDPRSLSTYRVRMEADKYTFPVLISNGSCLEEGALQENPDMGYAIWEDKILKPPYLFSFVAGKFAHVEDVYDPTEFLDAALEDVSGIKNISIHVYCHETERNRIGHLLRSIKKAMNWERKNLGKVYDLERFTVVAITDDRPTEILSHGVVILDDDLVMTDPDDRTDMDYQDIETRVAGLLLHHWTGCRICIEDAGHAVLRDGLTTYRTQRYSQDMSTPYVKRSRMVEVLRTRQFAEESSNAEHALIPYRSIDPVVQNDRGITTTISLKGAEIFRMLDLLLGSEMFQKSLAAFLDAVAGRVTNTFEFLDFISDFSGRDVRMMRRWFEQSGTPLLKVETTFDAQNSIFRLRLTQHTHPSPGQQDKKPLPIPVRVGLISQQGIPCPIMLDDEVSTEQQQETVILLTDTSKDFFFRGIKQKPYCSLFRGFSAPIRLETTLSNEDLLALVKYDVDYFNRWEVGKSLSARLMLSLLDKLKADETVVIPRMYFEMFEFLLMHRRSNHALTAKMLTLPEIDYLSQFQETIDFDLLYKVYRQVEVGLRDELRYSFLDVYYSKVTDNPYAMSTNSIGRRSIRNVALRYLMASEDNEVIDLCRKQFYRALNLTDRVAAFSYLLNYHRPETKEVTEKFYELYHGDPLLLNKWFNVQACSTREDTTLVVEALTKHPDFSYGNPHRVRALIHGFAIRNPLCFHNNTGSGYRLLTEAIRQVDIHSTPQAIGLVYPFARWSRYLPARQKQMMRQLEILLGQPTLSDPVKRKVDEILQSYYKVLPPISVTESQLPLYPG